jgi:uncharacterized protein
MTMQLNIKHLEIGNFSEDKRLAFHDRPDLSHIRQWGHAPYPQSAEVCGEVVSHLGLMTIHYKLSAIRRDSCARCLTQVEAPVEFEFSHRIAEGSPDDGHKAVYGGSDDEAVFATDGLIDLDELVASDLLLAQDQTILCSPDCKGLCPMCGCDLNRRDCDCQPDEDNATAVDSRFAALLEYMNDQEE